MKIRIGEVLWVSHTRKIASDTLSYLAVTRGDWQKGADTNKGIWAYKSVQEPGQKFARTPAILLHSNPLKEDSVNTPWVDIVDADLGYAIYHGDNRKSSSPALASRGNALLSRMHQFYVDPELRKFAPPILLFTQLEFGGRRKGFREFSGFGIPSHYMLVAQREKGSAKYFTNLVVELTLFRLDKEDESFDWNWINHRRNGNLTAEEALVCAPHAWKTWVNSGDIVIEKCRRMVVRHHVVKTREQLDYPERDKALLRSVVTYYRNRKHAFEGLAALVAERVIGKNCRRGWITRQSVDGGVDFVCRLDLGSGFSRVPVIVLGQAKCQESVSGKDLARLVARLQRGWIGVFVTTGVFSERTQLELYQDKYPVVLVNGKRLAKEIRLILNEEGITINDLLGRELTWYETNTKPLEPSRALDSLLFATQLVA